MNKITKISSSLCFSAFVCSSAFSFGTDPVSSYMTKGKPVANWVYSVGNGLNYFIPVIEQQAQTKRKNLVVSPSKKEVDGDAIRVKWKGKVVKNEWGGNALNDTYFNIGKNIIDIASVKDVAALVVELKVNKKPNKLTKLSMKCNYSNECKGEFELKIALSKLPKKTWTTLPIPLSCFNKDGNFDFSKVTDIGLATQGKMDLEIANIGLVGLPEGSKGC